MTEFFNLTGPSQAVDLISDQLTTVSTERVETFQSLGRIIAETVKSNGPIPQFVRSSMDGYSVRASDTFGATEPLPAYLEVIGEIPMGASSDISIKHGEAAIAYTGGMLAQAADAVVMIEHTEVTTGKLLQVFRPVAIGENTIPVGDDFAEGSTIVENGSIIDEKLIGSLLANGITSSTVFRRPTVAVLSAGDELVHPGCDPTPGKVRDINLYTIASSVRAMGANVKLYPRQSDQFEEQLAVARNALSECDVLVFTSGSSISVRDLTSQVVNSLGEPGVLIHGLTVKPGKPTVLGLCGTKPIIGLPGNPVSAMTIFGIVARPIILRVAGLKNNRHMLSRWATLTEDVSSLTGRTDFVRVKMRESNEGITATPVFGTSNSISILSYSDGYVEIPSEVSGVYAGTQVEIFLD